MLDAAEFLIRQGGGTDFSMRALASTAEVSPTTPYNFFGSKEGLLFALLKRDLESFMKEEVIHRSDDPIENVLDAADTAVTILLSDPIFLRPLYQVLLGLSDPIHRPIYLSNSFVFYRSILDPAVEHKLLDKREQIALASALMAYFMGVMDHWVHEAINDKCFRAQIRYGFIRLLWPIASGKSLTMLKKEYAAVQKVLFGQKMQPVFVTPARESKPQNIGLRDK